MRWRAMMMAALLALAPLARPAPVGAQAAEDATVERFDGEKFWTYVGCAAGIALGVGTGGWILAVVACGKAATAYWTK